MWLRSDGGKSCELLCIARSYPSCSQASYTSSGYGCCCFLLKFRESIQPVCGQVVKGRQVGLQAFYLTPSSLTVIQSVKKCLYCWRNPCWALGTRRGLAVELWTSSCLPLVQRGFFSCPSNKTGMYVVTLGLFLPHLL